MIHKFVAMMLSILLLTQITLPLHTISAEEKTPTQDEAKDLVQKGLTIFEIDKEVGRLNEQDASIVAQIKQNEQENHSPPLHPRRRYLRRR